MTKNQKGFIHLFLLVAIFLIVAGGVGYFLFKENTKIKTTSELASNEESQTLESESEKTAISVTLSPTSFPKLTTKPTNNQSPTPTPAPTDSTCPYNLTKQTGSVKVNIVSQNGAIEGDQIIELQAKSGCKVLLNKSTDKDTKTTKQGISVEFLAVPAGSYTVRSYYKGEWSGYHNTTVNSGQQTVVTVTVNVYSTPTPTP